MLVHEVQGPAVVDADTEVSRLLVTRQDVSRMYRPLGFLDARTTDESVDYEFSYLARAVRDPGFRPLLGFREVRRYESRGLFPLFSERLMDPRRPDRADFLAALALDADASPLLVLSRSGGRRVGDAIELTPVPLTDDQGRSQCIFLVHGVRHLMPAGGEVIDRLSEGDALALEPQPDNDHNERALLVTAEAGTPVGWVPDVLLDYVRGLSGASVHVVRANGPQVGSRLRLLVRVAGAAAPGWEPFSGPDWELAPSVA